MSELQSEHKQEIVKFLNAGQRLQAVKYAADNFKIALKDAIRLVNTVDQELHPDKKINLDSFSPRGMGLPKIFYIAFGGVGGLLLCIAAIMYYYDQHAMNSYRKTEGVVINFRYDEGAASPVVRYNWEGTDMTYYSSTYSNPPSFDLNETVELYVNPTDPEEAVINSFSERFLGMLIVGGLGAFFLGFILLFHKVMGK
jgi:hypothetical protein